MVSLDEGRVGYRKCVSENAPLLTCTLHLVRHGEVENPRGVIYGRLPGYNLSERGRRQAAAAARRLRDADLAAVWASPLERAQETAQAGEFGRLIVH